MRKYLKAKIRKHLASQNILTNTYLYDYILLAEERNNLQFFFKPVNHELQSVYFKVFYHSFLALL